MQNLHGNRPVGFAASTTGFEAVDTSVLLSRKLSVVFLLVSSPFSLLESLRLGIGGGTFVFVGTRGKVPDPFCFGSVEVDFANALLAMPSSFPTPTFTLEGSRRRGGIGGFPFVGETAEPFCVTENCDVGPIPMVEYSSSQTLSMMPVRTKRQSSQVVRRRARHHPVVQSG